MARDKSKDDKFFNCSQESEHNYVIGLYSHEKRDKVRSLLVGFCKNGTLKYSTHREVYLTIQQNLGFAIPI